MTRQFLNCNKGRRCPWCGGWERCSVHIGGEIIVCRNWEANAGYEGRERDGVRYWVHRREEILDPGRRKHLLGAGARGSEALGQPRLSEVLEALISLCPLRVTHIKDLIRRYGKRGEGREGELAQQFVHRNRYGTSESYWSVVAAEKLLEGICSEEELLRVPGFYREGDRVAANFPPGEALMIPVRDEWERVSGIKFRCSSGGGPRYIWFSSGARGGLGAEAMVHYPAGSVRRAREGARLVITEGELKADIASALSDDLVISVPGASCWRDALFAIERLEAAHGYRPQEIVLAFDADARTNERVARSQEALCAALVEEWGLWARVGVETWDSRVGKGLDDVLAAGGERETLWGDAARDYLADIVRRAGEDATEERLELLLSRVEGGELANEAKLDLVLGADTVLFLSRLDPEELARVEAACERGIKGFKRAEFEALVFAQRLRSDERPKISVYNRQVNDVAVEAKRALLASNDPPFLFASGNGVAMYDKWARALVPLNRLGLRSMLDGAAIWLNAGKRSMGRCPEGVADYIYDRRELLEELPRVYDVVTWPILGPDGEVIATPGYHSEAGVILAKSELLESLTYKRDPDVRDVKAAVKLFRRTLCDFPFEDGASLANAIALILTHPSYLLISKKPLVAVTSEFPGTGKGKLVKACCRPFLSDGLRCAEYRRCEEEFGKVLSALIWAGRTHIYFDNVAVKMNSPALAMALTADQYEARLLGTSETRSAPVRAIFLATGNRLQTSRDIARRTVHIKLWSQTEDPHFRKDFVIPNLDEYIIASAPALVSAALTIACAWVREGCPRAKPALPLGSFDDWAGIIGGMLGVAGVEGFLGNAQESLTQLVTIEHDEEREFLQCSFERTMALLLHRKFSAKDLGAYLRSDPNFLLENLPGYTERGWAHRLGRMLHRNTGCIFELEVSDERKKFRLEQNGRDRRGAHLYRLNEVKDERTSGYLGKGEWEDD